MKRHYVILVWAYETGSPVYEARKSPHFGRYTVFSFEAMQFRTKGEAEAYANSEIRRFGLRAEVKTILTGTPKPGIATMARIEQRNKELRAAGF